MELICGSASTARFAVVALLALLVPDLAAAQVSVTTWHVDLARSGANTHETVLTPASVNKAQFGKLCSFPVDGQLYAEPLYVPGLQIGGQKHDLVFVATEHDSVYGSVKNGIAQSAVFGGISSGSCAASATAIRQ